MKPFDCCTSHNKPTEPVNGSNDEGTDLQTQKFFIQLVAFFSCQRGRIFMWSDMLVPPCTEKKGKLLCLLVFRIS